MKGETVASLPAEQHLIGRTQVKRLPFSFLDQDTEDLTIFSVTENGLLELFSQFHSHGEEVILREEIQVLLEGMDVGEAKCQAPPEPLSKLLLVES